MTEKKKRKPSEHNKRVGAWMRAHPGSSLSEANAAVRSGHHGGGGGESVVPTREGGGIKARGRTLVAHVEANAVLEYDKAALGAIWEGFVARARSKQKGGIDVSEVFPGAVQVEGESATNSAQRNARWMQLAQERAIGRQMYDVLGIVMEFFQLTPDDIASFAEAVWSGDSASADTSSADDSNAQSPV